MGSKTNPEQTGPTNSNDSNSNNNNNNNIKNNNQWNPKRNDTMESVENAAATSSLPAGLRKLGNLFQATEMKVGDKQQEKETFTKSNSNGKALSPASASSVQISIPSDTQANENIEAVENFAHTRIDVDSDPSNPVLFEETCDMISSMGGDLKENERALLKAIFENNGKERDTNNLNIDQDTTTLGIGEKKNDQKQDYSTSRTSHLLDDDLRRILEEDDLD